MWKTRRKKKLIKKRFFVRCSSLWQKERKKEYIQFSINRRRPSGRTLIKRFILFFFDMYIPFRQLLRFLIFHSKDQHCVNNIWYIRFGMRNFRTTNQQTRTISPPMGRINHGLSLCLNLKHNWMHNTQWQYRSRESVSERKKKHWCCLHFPIPKIKTESHAQRPGYIGIRHTCFMWNMYMSFWLTKLSNLESQANQPQFDWRALIMTDTTQRNNNNRLSLCDWYTNS